MSTRVVVRLFTPAPSVDNAGGVLGWVRLTLDDVLELDGLVVRRNSVGELTVSFPSRVDGAGYRRYFARPLNERVRAAICGQVIEQLRSTGRLLS